MFSHTLPAAERYADLLCTEGVVRGLIGPREAPRIWERHLVNCALLGTAIEAGVDVCDIGSGAGLPGLVLAIRRPDLKVTLVEPLLRRTTFLEEAVDNLGLPNVDVVRGRAEELHGSVDFAVVTSRAVAPLDRLLGWSMPLVRQGGTLLAMKGSSAQEEIDAAATELRRRGAGATEVLTLGAGVIDPPTTVVRVEATQLSRLGYDVRREGQRRSSRTSRKKGRNT
ncbi:MAG: 16S rRNA (guanine(527)-N(7))-methyltransferase RsmG [Nocardioidaceae bacterium]